MSMLSNMKSEGLEAQEDRIGGFQLKSTDLYEATIKLAYITESDGGAYGLNLTFQIGGSEYRENTIYFTNKDKENFYYTKDDKGNRTTTKAQLPGFNLVNNLCRLAIDKELYEIVEEEKTIKVYDSKEGKEIPKSMPCLTELHGSKVLLAITEQTVNKNKKNDNTGKYEPTSETREENQIDHVFHWDLRATVNELTAIAKAEAEGKPAPKIEFADKWLERYAGKKADKRTIKEGGDAPKQGRPSPAGSSGDKPAATSSLFNRNK